MQASESPLLVSAHLGQHLQPAHMTGFVAHSMGPALSYIIIFYLMSLNTWPELSAMRLQNFLWHITSVLMSIYSEP